MPSAGAYKCPLVLLDNTGTQFGLYCKVLKKRPNGMDSVPHRIRLLQVIKATPHLLEPASDDLG